MALAELLYFQGYRLHVYFLKQSITAPQGFPMRKIPTEKQLTRRWRILTSQSVKVLGILLNRTP